MALLSGVSCVTRSDWLSLLLLGLSCSPIGPFPQHSFLSANQRPGFKAIDAPHDQYRGSVTSLALPHRLVTIYIKRVYSCGRRHQWVTLALTDPISFFLFVSMCRLQDHFIVIKMHQSTYVRHNCHYRFNFHRWTCFHLYLFNLRRLFIQLFSFG